MTELVLIKLIISISMVLILSFLAEYMSPKIAGIISGFPTGSAVSLFFFAYEISPEFAAESAVYNLAGLSSMGIFIFVYYLVSKNTKQNSILLSSIGSIIAYFISIFILKMIPLSTLTALLIALASTFFFIFIFRNIENTKITKRKSLSFKSIFLRSILAGIIIFTVTLAPQKFNSQYSGLFSAFPTTLFPLVLIINLNYTKNDVHTLLKNAPTGLLSLIVFSVSVSYFFPTLGLIKGMIISYGLAIIWLFVLFNLKRIKFNYK